MPEPVDPNEWDRLIAAADEMIARERRQRDALLAIAESAELPPEYFKLCLTLLTGTIEKLEREYAEAKGQPDKLAAFVIGQRYFG